MQTSTIRLLQTEERELTDGRDKAKAINAFFIEGIKHMAAGIDDGASQPFPTEQRTINELAPDLVSHPWMRVWSWINRYVC